MKKKRIVHLITRLDRGGAPEIAFRMAKHQKSMGHDVILVSGNTESKARQYYESGAASAGLSVKWIRHLAGPVRPVNDIISSIELLCFFAGYKPDVIHAHTSKAGFMGRWIGRIAGAGIIIYMPHGHVFKGYFGEYVSRFFVFLERISAFLADRIITLSYDETHAFLSLGIGKEEQFVTIRNGIDIKASEVYREECDRIRKNLGILPDGRVILCAARLERVKGISDAVLAFASVLRRCPGCVMIVAGEGSMKKELEELCKKLKLGKSVLFLGYRDDIIELIAISDVTVLSSRMEGMGIILLEAMSMGCPVAATRVGGIPEVVEDGVTGILVNPQRPGELAQALIAILADKEKAKRMGEAGREKVQKYFSEEKMLDALDKLYRSIDAI